MDDQEPSSPPEDVEQRPANEGRGTETTIELLATVAAPSIVLLFLSGDAWLGARLGLIFALLFPLLHAGRSLLRAEQISPFAMLAVVSISLTGGIGLLELDPEWLALKEAAFPLGIGIMFLVSSRRERPLLMPLLERVLSMRKIEALIEDRAAWNEALRRATVFVGLVLCGSAAVTYVLARTLVVSDAGTPAFNEELGRFTALGLPVIGLPSAVGMGVVLRTLLLRIEALTGKDIDDLVA
jgi:hypothetical protein